MNSLPLSDNGWTYPHGDNSRSSALTCPEMDYEIWLSRQYTEGTKVRSNDEYTSVVKRFSHLVTNFFVLLSR